MSGSPVWVVILSAAVGSLAASLITVIGQAFERRARQRELFLSKAIEMARAQHQLIRDVIDKSGGSATLRPEIEGTLEFFEALQMLFHKGRLPEKVLAQIAAEDARLDAEDEARAADGKRPRLR